MTLDLTYAALQVPDLVRHATLGSHVLDPTIPDNPGRLARIREALGQRAAARRSSLAAAPAPTPDTSVPTTG